MKYLLIGNGPSALAYEQGRQIDGFDGTVVRFNNYITKGYEPFVGRRTDVWATVGAYPEGVASVHKDRWWVQLSTSDAHEKSRLELRCNKMPDGWRAHALADVSAPSSGLAVASYLLSNGHEVWLWGFDFMPPLRKHHYGDNQARGTTHKWCDESVWFTSRLIASKIFYLGWDRGKQGLPIVRIPTPCGTNTNPAAGREPTQMGWYEWIGRTFAGKTVLDVGAGTCKGLRVLDQYCPACGQDVDERLAGVHPRLTIKGVSSFPDKSVDVVTAVDVLEHVVDDLSFVRELKRIAKSSVVVTTPNGLRSQCQNTAHCREYTIQQFASVFRPVEMWSGSPDGRVHITKLLTSYGPFHYIDHSDEGPDNKLLGRTRLIRVDDLMGLRFNNTVDGEEWPHITAVLNPE